MASKAAATLDTLDVSVDSFSQTEGGNMPTTATRDKGQNGKTKPRRETAETMATRQKDIAVSEFFAKNRHLLGFDNPRKALLTTLRTRRNALDPARRLAASPTFGHIEDLQPAARQRQAVPTRHGGRQRRIVRRGRNVSAVLFGSTCFTR